MAEIDKGLPNVRQNVTIPSPDQKVEIETQIQESIPSSENTEITENEDGSVDVDFDPGSMSPESSGDHYANLADLLPDSNNGATAFTLLCLSFPRDGVKLTTGIPIFLNS